MLKILLQNNVSFKISSLLSHPNGKQCYLALKKEFTYKNPDYIEARKWGRSVWNIEKFLYSYWELGDEIKFYFGTLKRIKKKMDLFNIPFEVVDYTLICPPIDVIRDTKFEPYDSQVDFINSYIDHIKRLENKTGIALANTSFGKCHAKGTEIIMFDGSLKKVEDIKVGDLLMGNDSTPRKVLSLGRGKDELYEVSGNFKEKFVCNSDHILSLKVTSSKSNHIYKNTDHIEISIKDYLKLNNSRKHYLKLWGTGVEFSSKKIKIPPYFLGLWIGDGSKSSNHITNNDEPEIVSYLDKLASKNNFQLHRYKSENRTANFNLRTGLNEKNPIKRFLLKNCVKDGVKFIPNDYLINSKENRLELLAGIIDSDGHLIKSNYKTYEIVSKDLRLAEQIAFLSRSLGFAARIYKKKSHYIKNNKKINTGFCYRVFISGNTEIIPVKLKRKKASNRKMRTNPLISGFKIRSVGVGDYYGFTLDGNGLYLLKDFTVTHNTFTAVFLAEKIQQPVLIFVHTTVLQKQWIKDLKENFGVSAKDIGGAGGVFKKPSVRKINVCLYHSMCKKEINIFFRDKVGFLIVDECQKVAIKQFINALKPFRTRYRLGMSAGINRKDGKSFIIKDMLGDIFFISEEENSDSKILANIFFTKTNWSPLEAEDPSSIATEASRDYNRNLTIARSAVRAVKNKRQTIIFVERKEQAAVLAKFLHKLGVGILIGKVPRKQIAKLDISDKAKEILLNNDPDKALDIVKQQALDKKIMVIIATQKVEVGFSVQTLGHGISTTNVGNNAERFNQILGRVERKHTDKILDKYGEKPVPTFQVMVDNTAASINAGSAIKKIYKDRIIKNPYKKEKKYGQ